MTDRRLLRVEYTYAYVRHDHLVLRRQVWSSTPDGHEPTWHVHAETQTDSDARDIIDALRAAEFDRAEAEFDRAANAQ